MLIKSVLLSSAWPSLANSKKNRLYVCLIHSQTSHYSYRKSHIRLDTQSPVSMPVWAMPNYVLLCVTLIVRACKIASYLPFLALSMASSMGSLINFLFLEGEGCSHDSIPLEATDAPEDGEVTLEEALEGVLVEMVETLTGY